MVEQDARLSVKDIADCTGISEGSVQTILKKRLDLRKVCARWVCLFVLRFYGPVNPMGSCRARSVYLTTRLLGKLSPVSG